MRSLLLLCAVVGCTHIDTGDSEVAEWAPSASDAVLPPPGTLEVALRGSGVLGTVVTIEITGALPDEKVTIARGMNGIGVGPCLAPLGDQCLGIVAPVQVLGREWVDGDGTASEGMQLPGSDVHEGSEWCVQAVAVRSGGLDAEFSTVACVTLGRDSDGDGVLDLADVCDGGDDTVDPDGDGVPSDCDACPLDATDDSDGDGVCDGADVCPSDPDDLCVGAGAGSWTGPINGEGIIEVIFLPLPFTFFNTLTLEIDSEGHAWGTFDEPDLGGTFCLFGSAVGPNLLEGDLTEADPAGCASLAGSDVDYVAWTATITDTELNGTLEYNSDDPFAADLGDLLFMVADFDLTLDP